MLRGRHVANPSAGQGCSPGSKPSCGNVACTRQVCNKFQGVHCAVLQAVGTMVSQLLCYICVYAAFTWGRLAGRCLLIYRLALV